MSETTPTSPDQHRRVQRVARWIWSAVIVMAGVCGGALVARSYDAHRDHALRQSPAGPHFGHIMPRLQLDQPTLREALRVLAEQSGAKIEVDWAAIKDDGVECDTPLKLQWRLQDVSLDQVLDRLLGYAPMTGPNVSRSDIIVRPTPTSLHITMADARPATVWKPAPPIVMRIYDVEALLRKIHIGRAEFPDGQEDPFGFGNSAQLVPNDEAYLEDEVRRMVQPGTWMYAGGSTGTVKCVSRKLFVLQRPAFQDEVEEALADLNDPEPPDRRSSRDAYDETELDRIVPNPKLGHLTFYHAVESLRQQTGVNIFVNWQRLSEARVMPDVGVGISLDHATLEQAITSLVAHVESRDRVAAWGIRDGMISISTAQDLGPESLIMRSYPVQDLLDRLERRPVPPVPRLPSGVKAAKFDEGASLVELIVKNVSTDQWRVGGDGDDKLRRHCYARAWAGRLFVLQTRPNQRKIARFLQSMREEK